MGEDGMGEDGWGWSRQLTVDCALVKSIRSFLLGEMRVQTHRIITLNHHSKLGW